MNCNLTYDHFKECINLGKELGFSFFSFQEFLDKKPKDKFIIMRHDIDLSLKLAVKLAELENSLGLKSTYFVRITGVFNPFYRENLESIRKISAFGHEIGIHYDSFYMDESDFKTFFLGQKKSLEIVTKEKIHGASIHKIKEVNNPDEITKLNFVESKLSELDLEYDAYSDIFIKDIKFISDSAFKWREGCMCKHIKKKTKLCILTHPISWSSDTTSIVSKIEQLMNP